MCASFSTLNFESINDLAGRLGETSKHYEVSEFFEFFWPLESVQRTAKMTSVAWTQPRNITDAPFLVFRSRDLHSRIGKKYLHVDKINIGSAVIRFYLFTRHFLGTLPSVTHVIHRKVCWIWWLLLRIWWLWWLLGLVLWIIPLRPVSAYVICPLKAFSRKSGIKCYLAMVSSWL